MGWADVPDATESLAVVCTSRGRKSDVFYHWVVYNIPPDVRGLDGKQPKESSLHKGIRQSRNSGGGWGWEGPDTHRRKVLRFRLFALDTVLKEKNCGEPDGCVRSMDGHLVEEAALVGRVGYGGGPTGLRGAEAGARGEGR